MDIALAQINTVLGDFDLNCQKIIANIKKACDVEADLVLFPELTLSGYAPNDLLERPEFYKSQKQLLKKISLSTNSKTAAVVGFIHQEGKHLFNAAAFLHNKKIVKIFKKELLPSYDVFDERRHFKPGNLKNNFIKFKGKLLLVAICEDLWGHNEDKYGFDPISKLSKKPDIVLSLNASPYYKDKFKVREAVAKRIVKKFSCPLYYSNQVGGQDELIFDGQSFALDKHAKKIFKLNAFEETFFKKGQKLKIKKTKVLDALIMGVRDYFDKTGFKKAHLGLSGGIDSALVLYIACKALGSENVLGVAMPGPHSSDLSFKLAEKISKNLGSQFKTFDINSSYKNFILDFEASFGESQFDIMNENAQARMRGLALMAHSNRSKSLLLATSNKSELTVGYSTLYGDQCGALMPIGDLLKTEVFKICNEINEIEGYAAIPKKIISRPPSAELRADQKDSDSLPDYSKLDESINRVITQMKPAKSDLDKWVLNRSFMSEFKRWQSAPVLKVSAHSYGIGRRMPLAHKFKY
jgi:NAD+ synthase (glutamine-hydrolysing)